MKKVGDKINCEVVTLPSGARKIVTKPEDREYPITNQKFKILKVDTVNSLYSVAVDDDMIGWSLSEWHQLYWDIGKEYNGKKYFDVGF
jgi:ribosomal protein S19